MKDVISVSPSSLYASSFQQSESADIAEEMHVEPIDKKVQMLLVESAHSAGLLFC